MEKGILHLHITSVIIFLLLFLIKTIVLLSGKSVALDNIRKKTKVVEMTLGTLILSTGMYLLFMRPVRETWLIVKTILVLILIPVGIISMKKRKKGTALLVLIGFLYLYGVSETKSLVFRQTRPDFYSQTTKEEPKSVQGAVIYKKLCVNCHGENGKLGAYGSKDLSISKLTLPEKVQVISSGRGLMQGYARILTKEEIEAVAAYTETLK